MVRLLRLDVLQLGLELARAHRKRTVAAAKAGENDNFTNTSRTSRDARRLDVDVSQH